MRRLLPWLVFPILMLTAEGGLLLALANDLPILLFLAVGALVLAGAVLALEQWLPFAEQWQRPRGDVLTDVCHLVVTGWFIGSLPSLSLRDGLGLNIWPAHWPLALQVLIAVAFADFLNYWVHRVMHGSLWRLHAVHHSALRLYWINTWRRHPLEALCDAFIAASPLVLLGAPAEVTLHAFVVTSTFAMIQHSNVNVRGGPLNWILATPELHRWHHSRARREADANFGSVFIVWDALFGTRYFPKDRAPPLRLGIPEMDDFPKGYGGQLVAPFQRSLWERRSRGGSGSGTPQ